MLRLVAICGVPVARHRSQLVPCGYNDGPSFVGQEVLADAMADFGSMMPMIEAKGRAVGNSRWWWLDKVGALGSRKFMMENCTIGCSKMNQATRDVIHLGRSSEETVIWQVKRPTLNQLERSKLVVWRRSMEDVIKYTIGTRRLVYYDKLFPT
ncbi:hypothetical protein J6590_098548 [Homalodisca vitripennis]|nr:hypothetical protein J6590_098548 [Homalodisca vitripennis]